MLINLTSNLLGRDILEVGRCFYSQKSLYHYTNKANIQTSYRMYFAPKFRTVVHNQENMILWQMSRNRRYMYISMLQFNLTGGWTPHTAVCSLPLPSGMGENIGEKQKQQKNPTQNQTKQPPPTTTTKM